MSDAHDKYEELLDDIRALRDGLRPFATAAEKYGETWNDKMTARESGFKVGDLRHARTALFLSERKFRG